jgi:hypothetical protein
MFRWKIVSLLLTLTQIILEIANVLGIDGHRYLKSNDYFVNSIKKSFKNNNYFATCYWPTQKNNDYFVTCYLPNNKVSINSLLITVPKKKYRLFC